MGKEIIFGEMVEKYMRKHNLTMKELGEKVGRGESTVSMWISGKAIPKMGIIQDLADFFGIPTDTLIYGEEPNKEYPIITNPQDAMLFVIKNPIMMNYGGYDINKMSDEEIIEFANQTIDYMKYAAQKYKK